MNDAAQIGQSYFDLPIVRLFAAAASLFIFSSSFRLAAAATFAFSSLRSSSLAKMSGLVLKTGLGDLENVKDDLSCGCGRCRFTFGVKVGEGGR